MSKILEAIAAHALSKANSVALSSAGLKLTYRDLHRTIADTATVLASQCPGKRPIALCADNSPAWVLVDLAAVKLSRVLVPLPGFFTPAQREHALAQAGVEYLISDTGAAGQTLDILGTCYEIARPNFAPASLPSGTAKITYTSGTTGQPKGVCLSQGSMEQVSSSLVSEIGTDYAGLHCAVLPLAVLLENIAGLNTVLLAGGQYYVLPQDKIGLGRSFMPDFAALTNALAQCRANTTIVVPEILRGILQVLSTRKDRLPAMRLMAVGGARVAPKLLDAAAALRLPVYQGYGLSEAASVVAFNTPRANRPGSVGRVLPHVHLTLKDDGEVILRDPALLGYAGGEGAPSEYATGDIARMDEDGFVFVEGRKSNVLITGFGRNVAPEWVESELLAQPEIGQALAFGDAMPQLGALIVPSSATVDNCALARAIANANEALPEYARIGHWTKVFPFTSTNGQLTGNGRLRREIIHKAYRDTMLRCLDTLGQYVSFFERLVKDTANERAYLMATPQICDGLEGLISLETYRLYLAQAYHHVKHTVPLLKRARDLVAHDRAWMREALEEYIREESGHEEWILDDVGNSGGDADSIRAGAPAPETEFMVAYAYDFVNRVNPVGLFGMVFVLEGTSTQLATRGAHALMQSLKLPPNCFRYLISHGALDIGHMHFFQSLMNRIDDPADQDAIVHMAKRIFVLFANMFRGIPHERPVQHAA